MKQLTDEQQAILAAQGDLKINAVAGSGKTTTLVEYARSRPPGSKLLYLAFNRTVREEAAQRFAAANMPDVRVETAHSLAFKDIIRRKNLQLTNNYKPYELARQLNIKAKDAEIKYLLATHCQRFLQHYLNSSAAKLQDVNYVRSLTDPKAKSFVDRHAEDIYGYTAKALKLIETGEMPCLHDYYLKLYQLKKPRLNYDYLLFDEGQDASGVMLDVLVQQDKATKVVVGDVHQQIYSWRQAVNSLQQLPYPNFNLSTSFRFPEEIASVARRVLSFKRLLPFPFVEPLLRGMGTENGTVQSRATLARSNLFLLDKAIDMLQAGELKSIWFEGNISAYTFATDGTSIFDVLNLQEGRQGKVRDPLLQGLGSFEKLEEYLEKAEDPELAMITEMVRKYGSSLPSFIQTLKNLHVKPEEREQAGMIFSTVHRSKGLEYDEIQLTADFITEEKVVRTLGDDDAAKISRLNEEINLLYVAITRARHKLCMPVKIWPAGAVMPLPSSETHDISHFRRRFNPYNRIDKRHWEWGHMKEPAFQYGDLQLDERLEEELLSHHSQYREKGSDPDDPHEVP